MQRRTFLRGLAASTALSPALGPTLGQGPGGRASTASASRFGGTGFAMVWDDFRSGFSHSGPDAKWTLTSLGTFPDGDGIATTSSRGLRVVPTGTNPATGEPAFVQTTGQEHEGGGGQADHGKWYAVTNHTSSAGFPGFDATPGSVLTFETIMSARTFGVDGHPFGTAVPEPQADLRLSAGAMSVIDFETNMVSDFFITDHCLYAFYERLPREGRTYAAFSYALPVARRTPDQQHHLQISFDKMAGAVTWRADGRTVLCVDRVGRRPADRTNLLLDLGGMEEDVSPRQFAGALGMFTLLDAAGADGRGLVRLSDKQDLYYAPAEGYPHPARFLDDQSLAANRLWGQGAQLEVDRLKVSSRPRGATGLT